MDANQINKLLDSEAFKEELKHEMELAVIEDWDWSYEDKGGEYHFDVFKSEYAVERVINLLKEKLKINSEG